MILEFQTQTEADACLAVINQLAETYWVQQGYTVENHQLIGKNAATGEDEPMDTRTTTWDVVRASPVGTYYFTSLTGTHFEAGMTHLPQSVFNYTEKQYPQEWVTQEV